MDADAELEGGVRPMADAEGLDLRQQRHGHGGDLAGVKITVSYGQAGDHHVCIADCLHFVNVVVFDSGVEGCVQVVQHVNHL